MINGPDSPTACATGNVPVNRRDVASANTTPAARSSSTTPCVRGPMSPPAPSSVPSRSAATRRNATTPPSPSIDKEPSHHQINRQRRHQRQCDEQQRRIGAPTPRVDSVGGRVTTYLMRNFHPRDGQLRDAAANETRSGQQKYEST